MKKATGYEGSKLQEAKENFAQGFDSTKKVGQDVYGTAAKKVSDIGTDVQYKAGQKTKEAGDYLK